MHMLRCIHTDVWVPFMNPSLYECRTPPAHSQTHRERLACYVATWWVGGLLNVDFNYKHLFPVTSQWTWREVSWIKTHTYMYFFQKCNCNIVSVFEDSDLQWSAHFLMIFSVIGILIQSKLKYLLNLVFEGIFCTLLDSSLNSHI